MDPATTNAGRAAAAAGDRDLYRAAGFGRPVPRGKRPAILVVDFSRGFTDPAVPTGADMAEELAATRRLLDLGREKGVPAVFTTIAFDAAQLDSLPWLHKAPGMAALVQGSPLVAVDQRLARRREEPLIVKTGASAFFGTPLAAQLAAWRTDTVIVTGATTSGCVRASVVDAMQSGFHVLVPRDCVADRAAAPHEANLFDMQQKYADVIPLDEVLAYLGGLPAAAAAEGGRL
ncbi:isochorismatase family protein [Marinibaculum pumilum]|uniref:Isochorismatase family protein n=1 Tax=Marinibaculum pumilum TaxID=1766165 RepID=A0ABV7L1F1_9PROT